MRIWIHLRWVPLVLILGNIGRIQVLGPYHGTHFTNIHYGFGFEVQDGPGQCLHHYSKTRYD